MSPLAFQSAFSSLSVTKFTLRQLEDVTLIREERETGQQKLDYNDRRRISLRAAKPATAQLLLEEFLLHVRPVFLKDVEEGIFADQDAPPAKVLRECTVFRRIVGVRDSR